MSEQIRLPAYDTQQPVLCSSLVPPHGLELPMRPCSLRYRWHLPCGLSTVQPSCFAIRPELHIPAPSGDRAFVQRHDDTPNGSQTTGASRIIVVANRWSRLRPAGGLSCGSR